MHDGSALTQPTLGPVHMLRAENSVQFLEAVFEMYKTRQVFAIQRADTGLEDLVETLPAPDTSEGSRGWVKLSYSPDQSNEPAQIVFTSGTEGKPKPIVLSHRNLADVTERLNAMMEPTADIREYIGVPVTYSFGIGRARAVAAAGGQCYLPEHFNPAEIRDMLEAGSINAISAVPSLWRVVLQNPEVLQGVGNRVRWIEIGSQAMSADEKAAMKRLFPKAKIVMHYGLTEASRTTLLDISATDDARLGSVGVAVGDVALRLGQDDAIEIRGPHVALGKLTEGGVIEPLTDDEGWLTTKDRGRIDGDDLYFEGRLDDQINVGGIKTYAEALEHSIVALVPSASGHFAIGARPDEMRGMTVVLAVAHSAKHLRDVLTAATETALEAAGIAAQGVVTTVDVDTLPVTETGKVRRNSLAELAETATQAGGAAEATDGAALSGTMAKVAEAWSKVQPDAAIGAKDSLYTLGADSLTSVQVAMTMETMGFQKEAVQAALEGRTVEDIAMLADGGAEAASRSRALPKITVEQWAISGVRGFMILMVLVSHWGRGLFGRVGLEDLDTYVLSLFYRMGTEGFAAGFGLGIAYMLADYEEKTGFYLKRMRFNFVLVSVGLLAIAVAKFGAATLNDTVTPAPAITGYLYNVLMFFAIAMGTAPLWLGPLAKLKDSVVGVAAVAACFVVLDAAVEALFGGPPLGNAFEVVRLMGVGGYSVFKMSAITLAGVAAGLALIKMSSHAVAVRSLMLGGACIMIVCGAAIFQIGGFDAFLPSRESLLRTTLGDLLYVGFAITLLGGLISLFDRYDRLPFPAIFPARLLVVAGGLAFAIYVAQALVIPVNRMIESFGVPEVIAIGVPMAAFLGVIGFLSIRLYRSYF